MNAKCAILLATYNGGNFVEDQLNSYCNQQGVDWKLWVSDDGSTDKTLDVIKKFQSKNPNVVCHLLNGPRDGYSANFLSLLERCNDRSDYFAFSDQDDIWHPEKLKRAIEKLSTVPSNVPAVYAGRTTLVDEHLRFIRYSPKLAFQPSFRNSLVQNVMPGNTMVLNAAARKLVCASAPRRRVPSHDWWVYLLVASMSGELIFDDDSFVLYRQHQQNNGVANLGWRKMVSRMYSVLTGNSIERIKTNLDCLEEFREKLSSSNKSDFCFLYSSFQSGQGLWGRLGMTIKSGARRQNKAETMLLCLSRLFK